MRKSILLPAAVAAVALTAPATALAATPKAGALYGGGEAAANGERQFTSARVQKDGTKVNFFGEWAVRCDDGAEDLAFVTAENTALNADGSFSGTGQIQDSGPLGSQTGTFEFSGSFVSPHKATGTGKVDIQRTLTAGGGGPCSSGTIRWTLIDPAQDGARAKRGPSATFYGSTSQTFPTIMRLTPSGKRWSFAAVEFELKCKKEQNPFFLNESMPSKFIKSGRNGSFRGREVYTNTGMTVQGNGDLVITARLKGALRRGKLTGTWNMTARVVDRTTKKVIDTCSSERITFAAASA